MGYIQEKLERQDALVEKIRITGTYSKEDNGGYSGLGLLLMLLMGPGLGGLFGIGGGFARSFPGPEWWFPWWVHPVAIVLSFIICPWIDRKFFNSRYGDATAALEHFE